MIGDPVAHWRAVRREVRLVRQFRATDALASGLGLGNVGNAAGLLASLDILDLEVS
jgi:hypothetical protein